MAPASFDHLSAAGATVLGPRPEVLPTSPRPGCGLLLHQQHCPWLAAFSTIVDRGVGCPRDRSTPDAGRGRRLAAVATHSGGVDRWRDRFLLGPPVDARNPRSLA